MCVLDCNLNSVFLDLAHIKKFKNNEFTFEPEDNEI